MTLGRVLCVLGRELLVEANGALLQATPAGRLKVRGSREMPVAGDLVRLRRGGSASCTVTGIEPRSTVFTRAGFRGAAVAVVANLELLVVVVSTEAPAPSLVELDRFLAMGERGRLRCAVCLNKVDLGGGPKEIAAYPGCGYPVLYTSAVTGAGLEDLGTLLRGRLAALVGASGTGKSSLVNALLGTEAQHVREIARIGRGRHTTTSSRLLPLGDGGFIADTPGIGWLGMADGSPNELAKLFPEIRAAAARCRFADCAHRTEPECAVKEAVISGAIAAHRHGSYLALVEEGAGRVGGEPHRRG